jgi:hypothetical protein
VKLFALYLLASLDGLLCGFRTAAGRCPLIRTRSYYVRALFRGFLAAQFATLLGLLSLLFFLSFSSHRFELRGDLESSAARMLWVFLPYAFIVLLSLSLRLVPSTDLRAPLASLRSGHLLPFVQ